MSVELQARITTSEPLAEVLGHAERYIPTVPRSSFAVTARGHETDIVVGPFPVPDVRGLLDNTRSYKAAFSAWDLDVIVSIDEIAKIGLMVGYVPRLDEAELGSYVPVEADWRENEATAGYCVIVDAGLHRTRASLCLASLVICAVAERNRSRILDDAGKLLKLGRFIDPSSLVQIFARHARASSFEAFADAFCDDIGFAANWR